MKKDKLSIKVINTQLEISTAVIMQEIEKKIEDQQGNIQNQVVIQKL